MDKRLMLLPSKDFQRIRLIRIPDDFESHEAYRLATGIIAGVNPASSWEEIADALESRGLQAVDFILGPSLDP